MNAYITTEYKLSETEIKNIIREYFERETGIHVDHNQITMEISHLNYCEPELKNAIITVETVKNNVTKVFNDGNI